MPVTLVQAQQSTTDAISLALYDEFRRSPLLDRIPFEQVTASVGGDTLTYTYSRITSYPTAGFRAFNEEYTPDQAGSERVSVDLKPLGGSFEVDRLLANLGPAATSPLQRQLTALVTAARYAWVNAVINGDKATDSKGFDGLAKLLKGASTEDKTAHDWSDGLSSREKALGVLSTVDDLLQTLDGDANLIVGNRAAINRLRAAMRLAGADTTVPGPRETTLLTYGGAVVIEAGLKPGGSKEIIDSKGKGIIYALRTGVDGFHAVSVDNSELLRYYLPNFTTPGAVKKAEVELGPCAPVLRTTLCAAVANNITLTASPVGP